MMKEKSNPMVIKVRITGEDEREMREKNNTNPCRNLCEESLSLSTLMKELMEIADKISKGKRVKTSASKYKTVCTPISPNIKDMIYKVYSNEPYTVIIWKDYVKTVVRCSDSEPFDAEKGVAMAIIKRLCGNKSVYNEIFHEFLPESYFLKEPKVKMSCDIEEIGSEELVAKETEVEE